MLTVYALSNAQQAAQYYEQDNYYHKGSMEAIAATHWWGQGAEQLGLSGYVDPDRFAAMLRGQINDDTLIQRVRHDGGVGHKPGYDLTFSAPKSVSMLAEIGQDARIYEAHNHAVNAALDYMQSNAAMYRQTVDAHTQIKPSDNLIVAKFRHDTSRNVDETIDCQLHTHCVVVNATQCDDGQWRSLYEKPLFEAKMLGGMIYRSQLAQSLKELGYDIEKTREDGLFEVKGFSRDQIEAFSKRRVKIVEVMTEWGLFGAEAAQKANLVTRQNKTPVNRDKLHEHWQSRVQELGINLDKMIASASLKSKSRPLSKSDPESLADRALQYAMSHLGERQSVFTKQAACKTALQYALGDVQLQAIDNAMDRFQEQDKLIYIGKHNHLDLYTTPKVIEQERHIVNMMQAGKNEVDAIASCEAVDLYLKDLMATRSNVTKLTDCQMKAIHFLSTTTDRVVGVQGYAGTGKTTMLQSVCRLAEQSGYQIRGAAPSASAADVLRSDTGIKTETLSGLLLALNKENPPQDISDKPELIILDEASMASTHQMHDLMKRADKLNKRLMLVGDQQQLPSVENGSPYALLQSEGMATAKLKQIMRQKAKDLAYAVKETLHGDVEYAMQAVGNEAFIERHADGEAVFSPDSTVNVIDHKQERLKTIADRYLALNEQQRDNTIVLLGSNEDRSEVNTMIRDGLQAKGVVTGDQAECNILQSKGSTAIERTHIYNYEPGDVVRFNKAYRSLGIKRYDYLKVVCLDSNTGELVLDRKGHMIRWQPQVSAQSKGGAVDVFTQDQRDLAAGDWIRWTQNKKNQSIYNTDTAQVVAVKGNKAQFKLKNNDIIELDLTKPINRHWDYAWSSTVYAAQGKKANNVIAQLEGANPNLTNYRSFYVTLSRAVNSIHLYVDDLDKAVKTIQNHTGEKSNATEFLVAHQQQRQFDEHIKTAHLKLDGHIHEQPHEFERLVNLAQHYVSASDQQPVHLVAADFKDRQRLNALIRHELKAAGKLEQADYTANSLRQYRVRSNDDRMGWAQGMVVGFERGYKKYGIHKGEYFTVSDVPALGNDIVLKNDQGRSIKVDSTFLVDRQDKDVTICKLDQLPLAVGDAITWRKTYQKDGIYKHQQAIVSNITSEAVTFELANQQSITFKHNDPKGMHWQYAYAQSLDVPAPKHYELGLAHLDERTKSPARIRAILGAMGQSQNEAHLYTHSQDYVVNQINLATDQRIDLQPHSDKTLQKDLYQALEQFEQSKKTVGKAWVSYFDNKQAGLATEDNLRNALILDRAHAELADQIVTNEAFDKRQVEALGINTEHMQQKADKHKVNELINRYEQTQGVMQAYYAKAIATSMNDCNGELYNRGIAKQAILTSADDYTRRLQRLKLTPQQRQDSRIVEAYFQYAQQARTMWQRINRSKENGVKPDRSHFTYASHICQLRNALAQTIVSQPKRFETATNHLSSKSHDLIKKHAQQFQTALAQQTQRKRALNTKDWRQVVHHDQKHWEQQRSITYQKSPKKIYWDKDSVLKAAMDKAEMIMSNLVEEQKNAKLSNGYKLVWGQKHGSVHLHLSGTKQGLINDYERGIHGDIIHYYAQRRGIDWYDALSELATETSLDPSQASIKTVNVSPEEKAQKQKAIADEQKRRYQTRQLAQTTWQQAQPIQGTLVETYLKKHRGLSGDISGLEMRYHPAAPNKVYYKNGQVKVGERRPAMVVSFLDRHDEITGVQCTYLDKTTANKDTTVKIGKNTIGQIWGSAGVIYKGGDDKVIACEGAETAASLVAVQPKSSIYATGGNMQNVGHYDFLTHQHNNRQLYIAADNDLSFEAGSWRATQAGARQLAKQGIQPMIAMPQAIKNQKTDYNDVLKRYDSKEVAKQFQASFAFGQQEIADDTQLIAIKPNDTNQIADTIGKSEQLYQLPEVAIKGRGKEKGEKTLGE